MKQLPWIIICILVLALIISILSQRPKPESDLIQKQTALIERKSEEIKSLRTDNSILQAKIDRDSVRSEAKTKAYNTDVKKRDSEIARLKRNPVVIRIREENPEIDSVFRAQEDLSAVKDYRIDSLNADLADLRVDMGKMKSNFEGIFNRQADQLQAEKAISENYKKQLRKVRRGNRWLKAGIVTSAVLGLVFGAQL